jgi:hypothetical protein
MSSFREGIRRVFRSLFIINDSPQRIAVGLGIGVFTGILPGMGPLAAMFVAVLVRANKAAAFCGSLLTNTWLSFVVLISSIKLGSALFGLPWQEEKEKWEALVKGFHFREIVSASFADILIPVVVGYLLIGIAAGLFAYLLALLLLKIKHRAGTRIH